MAHPELSNVAGTLATRTAFDHRAVVVADDQDTRLDALQALAEGLPSAHVVTGQRTAPGKTVFVFPGQGSQWAGMAVELLDSSPVFAARMAECAAALGEFVDWSLLGVLREEEGAPGFDRVDVVQPVLWAVMVSLAELWRATSLVFVIVVAGMQNVPRDYDEAAAVFGATYWQQVRHVILPQLRPSIQVALILRTILALEAFAVAQALTGRSFPLLVGETYQWYYTLQNPNVATAIALVVLALSMLAAVGYLRLMRRQPGIAG